MAFDERIREARYISPSGAEFVLQFDNVERTGGKKLAINELPQQDRTDVQDLGNVAERFPMSAYFTGADHDIAADSLWTALSERGPGTLRHPRFGDIPVIPATFAQAEKMVEGLGRTDFSIEFVRYYEQIKFPVTAVSFESAIDAITDDALAASVTDAVGKFDPENAADVADIKEQIQLEVDSYETAFAEILATSEEAQAEANRGIRMITNNLDGLIDEPLQLFTSLSNLMKIPATLVTSVTSKVAAYQRHLGSVIGSVPRTYSQAVARVQSLFYVAGGVSRSSTAGSLSSRHDAIKSAETVEAVFQSVSAMIESIEAENLVPAGGPTDGSIEGYTASPEILSQITQATTQARALLLEKSYSLKSERRVELATARTPLDLVAQFYGGSIDQLDDFIASNGLEGDDIILIPAGREVVYYA